MRPLRRTRLILCLLFLLSACTPAPAPDSAYAPGPMPTSTTEASDSSLLQEGDLVYPQAAEFAERLRRHGVDVHSLHHSKHAGFFKSGDLAAFIRADEGALEVLFFAEPAGAEQIVVTEQVEGERHIYILAGYPMLQSHRTIDSNRPFYFTAHGKLFTFTDDKALHEAVVELWAEATD